MGDPYDSDVPSTRPGDRIDIPADDDADTQEIPVIRPRRANENGALWVGAGALAGIVSLVVFGGGLGGGTPAENADSTVTLAPTTTTRTSVTRRSSTGTANARTATGAVSTRPQPATGPSTAPRPGGTDAPPVLRAQPAAAAVQLTVGGRRDKSVWVEVRRGDARGDQLFAGIVGQGVTRTFSAKGPLWLGVAWAPNATVAINGSTVDVPGGTEAYRVTVRGLQRLTNT